MATVNLDASNEVPISHRVTLVGVTGEGFTPFSQVNIGVFGTGRRVLGHALVEVKADGRFDWGSSVRPQRPCGSTMSVVVHDQDGTEADAVAEVFCP
jgi:hypothetical protein